VVAVSEVDPGLGNTGDTTRVPPPHGAILTARTRWS
jgi:hypothetical protein